MIAEQSTSLKTLTRPEMTQAWRAPVSRHAFSVIGTTALRLTRAMISWVGVAALPHATLWEASLIVNLLSERDKYKPEAYSLRFTTDSRLRG
jgi:hypothetical protein